MSFMCCTYNDKLSGKKYALRQKTIQPNYDVKKDKNRKYDSKQSISTLNASV